MILCKNCQSYQNVIPEQPLFAGFSVVVVAGGGAGKNLEINPNLTCNISYFLSDPGPVIVLPCHSLTEGIMLTFDKPSKTLHNICQSCDMDLTKFFVIHLPVKIFTCITLPMPYHYQAKV